MSKSRSVYQDFFYRAWRPTDEIGEVKFPFMGPSSDIIEGGFLDVVSFEQINSDLEKLHYRK